LNNFLKPGNHKTVKLIYVYDALCGWCYGFTPVIQQLQDLYKDMEFEILSGGMVLDDNRHPASTMHAYVMQAHKRVEAMTGVRFGKAFLEGLLPSSYLMDSEKPGIALTVFKQYQPQSAVSFAHDMQVAFNYEGQSLNDDAIYRTLAARYGLPADEFVAAMHQQSNKLATRQEFKQVQEWGITGFPAAILDTGKQLYLIARGYRPLEEMKTVIEQVKEKETS
jgi:putative protein-disulfide isomerase